MDKADIADQLIQEGLDQALAEHRAKAAVQQESRNDPHCEDCGELIPRKRREYIPGCSRCVSCQAYLEARQMHIRH